jgi:TDG/mug DNA glycosylase family protein
MPQLFGFAPIAVPPVRAVVLGSFPSTVSLACHEYYASSGNRFWALMSELCNFSRDARYVARARAVSRKGIAVWDVLAACKREGAADAGIVRGSERPNDFREFFARHPGIDTICFNGKKAAECYNRFVVPGLEKSAVGIRRVTLRSTSPANNAFGLDFLRVEWGAALGLGEP